MAKKKRAKKRQGISKHLHQRNGKWRNVNEILEEDQAKNEENYKQLSKKESNEL